MESLVRFFLQRSLLVHLTVIALLLGGVITATRVQREGFPSVTINRIVVTTVLPGAAARDVETKVTLPIEEAIEGLDGVDEIRSEVSNNLSVTQVDVLQDYSPDEVRRVEQDIRAAIDGVSSFPPELRDPPVIKVVEAAKLPIIEVAVAGDSASLPVATERLEKAIRRVDGVSSVTVVGLEDPEIRILLDPVRATEHKVSLAEVMRAIQRRNVTTTGGMLETSENRRQVVLDERLVSKKQVEDTVVRFSPGGGAVRIRDVARVEEARADKGLRVHANASPGVSLVVVKRASADILDTIDSVRREVESTPLPAGLKVSLVNDASFMTRNRLGLMANNGIVGIGLVIIALFIFLTRRAALWVSLAIPVVIAATLLVLPAFGMTLNMISLGGFVVVLGMLVDASVVVAERVELRRAEGLSGIEAAARGTLDVWRPVVASAVTTMLAFSPLVALGGLPGKFAWNVPAVVVIALVFSLLVSLLILPAQMAGGRRTAKVSSEPVKKRVFVTKLENWYRRTLIAALRRRYLVLTAFVVVFAVAMGIVRPRMPMVLFPQDESDALYLKVRTPTGTPLEQTEAVVAALERQLPALIGSDLIATTARVGHRQAEMLDRVQGSADHEAVISALFKPADRERTSAAWAELLTENLRIPDGAEVVYETRAVGPPVGRPVTIHIGSNGDEQRRATAAALVERLRSMPEVVDVDVDERAGIRQVDLRIDQEALVRLGLDIQTVATTVQASLRGVPVSETRDLEHTTTFRVRFDPKSRAGLEDFLDMPVRSARGQLVPLRDVVRPIEVDSVAQLFHRDGVRTATVTAAFRPGSKLTATSFAKLANKEIVPSFASADVDVYMGGEATETQETTADIGLAALLAIAGIFLVITLILDSFLEAALVASVIPFGAAGVILTFFFHGMPLSMFAMLGLIGLSGVVVNTSIVMVDAVHERLGELAADDLEGRRKAMVEAVVERLRPILVTTVTTVGGLLPTAYGLGGADAVLSPMSLAIAWGLIFATAITLLLVPSLYLIAEDARGLVRRGWKASRVTSS